MKTKTINVLILLLCMGAFMSINAQGRYNASTIIDDKELQTIPVANRDLSSILDQYKRGTQWAKNTLGGTAGVGYSEFDGNSETSYCVGGEYLYRIAGGEYNTSGAGYLGAFANYGFTNSDNFDQNIFKGGVKFSYFDPITPFNEVQLVYGANVFLENGSREFSGIEEDICGYGANIYTGANFRICDRLSAGVEVPVFSFLNRTFEANGNEFETDNFWVGLNKDNSVMATLRWVLDSGNNNQLEN